MQLEIFGKEHHGASLSKLDFGPTFNSQIVDWIKSDKNFLVILGPTGTGKTYLTSALYVHFLEKSLSIRYWKESTFFSRIRDSFNEEGAGDFLTVVKRVTDDFTVLYDDLGSQIPTDFRMDVLFHLIDERYNSCLPTFFSSNLSREDIYQMYGKRIYSRLFAQRNTIIDMEDFPDLRNPK